MIKKLTQLLSNFKEKVKKIFDYDVQKQAVSIQTIVETQTSTIQPNVQKTNSELEHKDSIEEKITKLFNKENLEDLARETGFIQRESSKIKGQDFIKLLTTESIEDKAISLGGLCDILVQINPEAKITPQALCERINKKESVEYMKKVFELSMRENLESIAKKIHIPAMGSFNRVLIEDSTKVELNEKLADHFKGSGGSASKSALKIDLVYELKTNRIADITFGSGNTPDQNEIRLINNLDKNDLFIRDLGYFKIESLFKANDNGVFFLSRLLKGVNIKIAKDICKGTGELVDYMSKRYPDQGVIDLEAELGEQKLPCRLIGYKLPEEVINERRRKAKKEAQKKGRTLSEDYLKWLEFSFFITNVPKKIWDAKIIGTIYRIRWNIELIFKYWKSFLHINILKGSHKERIENMVYGRLIMVVIIMMIYGYVAWYADNQLNKEASLCKLIQWIKRTRRLANAIQLNQISNFFKELFKETIEKKLCKQTRKRKTILQLIKEGIPYMDSFFKKETMLA